MEAPSGTLRLSKSLGVKSSMAVAIIAIIMLPDRAIVGVNIDNIIKETSNDAINITIEPSAVLLLYILFFPYFLPIKPANPSP